MEKQLKTSICLFLNSYLEQTKSWIIVIKIIKISSIMLFPSDWHSMNLYSCNKNWTIVYSVPGTDVGPGGMPVYKADLILCQIHMKLAFQWDKADKNKTLDDMLGSNDC